jgi:hypothetical protein
VAGEEEEAGDGRRGAREQATEKGEGLPPLPVRITPHSLCRTFCSLPYALGEDPRVVVDEMGQTNVLRG